LKALGLKDPTKHRGRSASAHFAAALAYREYENTMAAQLDEEAPADIAGQLGEGALTREEAEKELDKLPPPSVLAERAARRRELRGEATRTAFRLATYAIHFHLDRWLDVLRPLVEAAVVAKDQARFDALHRFAGLLRDRSLGALEMLAFDPGGLLETDEVWRYQVGRPDLYHAWRDARAEGLHGAGHYEVGPVTVVATVVLKGPHPTLADMIDGGMEPGIYSAAEAVAIKDRVLAEQEAALVEAVPQ
jgi:hypothetical protein